MLSLQDAAEAALPTDAATPDPDWLALIRTSRLNAPRPASLKTVRLGLVRGPRHPDGCEQHGYAFVAPLDGRGVLDASLWRRRRACCRVVRFRAGEHARFGLLKPTSGGFGAADWMFDFGPARSGDDEIVRRLGVRSFREGDCVTIGQRGEPRVFRVLSVKDFVLQDRLAPVSTPPCPTAAALRRAA
ncbi:MAG: hypothetical protein ABW275_08570 [Hansschlegelia sp.]